MLKKRYEEILKLSGIMEGTQVSYIFFDFHAECYENSNPLIELIDK